MQKFDKYVLAIHNKQFSHGFLDTLSLAGKSTFALLEWMLWRKHGPDTIEGSRNRDESTYPLGFATGVIVAKLGSRLRQSPLKNCGFCNLLANIRIPDYKGSITSVTDLLVACRYFNDPGHEQRWDREGTPSDIVVMAVIPESQWDSLWDFWDLTLSMGRSEPRGFLTCRLKDSDVSQSAKALQPAIDFSEIARLIQGCQQSHRDCQNKRTAWQPIAIYLIDCYSRKLIETTSSESYVALSYVWGGVSAGTLDSGTLPRTLEDAIQVTQSLGFKYIWIDQFCVNQHDNAIKHKQIRTMGMVYADAALTLVAASGSDANHGLPGAPNHPFPGKVQPSVVMDGCIISEEMAPIDIGIQKSVWAHRGWTFQEQFFSRRFLVFGQGQVSYECCRARYSPRYGTAGDWAEGLSKNWCPEWRSLWSGLHNRNTGAFGSLGIRFSYHHLVAQYWPRHLSFDADGLNAFAAILEHLKNLWDAELLRETKGEDVVGYKITFTAGMPHLLRHNAESPEPDLGVFVEGLVWDCNSPIKRRAGFPSWCWAGWIPLGTHKAYITWTAFDRKYKLLIRNVFFRSSPGIELSGGPTHHKTTLQRVSIADHGSSSIPEAVIFDAAVLRPSALSWYDGNDDPFLWGRYATWKLADRSVLKRDEFLSNFANRVYCLVALQQAEKVDRRRNEKEVTLLLARQVDHYRYERIGLVSTWLHDLSWPLDLDFRTLELI